MSKATRRQDPRNGKLIATWKWVSKSGKVVEIPVRMSMDTADGPFLDGNKKVGGRMGRRRHRVTDKVQIGVFLSEPRKIEVVGTDVEIVRKTVFSMLGNIYELDWQPYYRVKLTSPFYFDETGTGMSIEYETIEMAQEDGKWMWRYQHNRGFTVEEGQPKTGMDEDEMTALVPVTEENTVALDAICEQIDALRKYISDFMSPEKIQETLRKAVQKLLPVPDAS
ncbi:hypothetical protein LCGC14_0165210 [marine sediment metagenome]|uniref:Uncharacterized protein n=1 Tax=marine sediment metagenome TaxID=412755 RepID=A0A0F9VAU6_9ZZZZ